MSYIIWSPCVHVWIDSLDEQQQNNVGQIMHFETTLHTSPSCTNYGMSSYLRLSFYIFWLHLKNVYAPNFNLSISCEDMGNFWKSSNAMRCECSSSGPLCIFTSNVRNTNRIRCHHNRSSAPRYLMPHCSNWSKHEPHCTHKIHQL